MNRLISAIVIFLFSAGVASAANTVLNYAPSGTSGLRVTNDPANANGFVNNNIICDQAGTSSVTDVTKCASVNSNKLLVDPSGVTSPVSVVALPLPANAAQETGGNLATLAGAVTSAVVQINNKQVNGIALSTNNGVGDTGTQRVAIATGSGLALETGGNLAAIAAGVTAGVNQDNTKQIAGTATSVNNGAGDAGTQRVAVATGSGLALETGGNLATVAGSISAGVSQSNLKQIGGTAVVADPCQSTAKAYTPVSINTAVSQRIITGTTAKKTYLCSIFLLAAAADNVAIIEGTGTNCATVPVGVIGGNTSPTGLNLAANEGFVLAPGNSAIAATATAADDVCLITSSAVQLSGVVTSVQQ